MSIYNISISKQNCGEGNYFLWDEVLVGEGLKKLALKEYDIILYILHDKITEGQEDQTAQKSQNVRMSPIWAQVLYQAAGTRDSWELGDTLYSLYVPSRILNPLYKVECVIL